MSTGRSHFHDLYVLFRRRLVESEELAADADYNTKLWQILGVLAVPGLYASSALFGTLLAGDAAPIGVIRSVRIFFAAYSFTVTGFATLFQWDMLFPDRRDFLVLTQFPIRMRDLFAAKLASLGVLLAVLVATVNAGALAIMVLVLLMSQRAHNVHFVESVVAYIVCTVASAAFGFLLIASLQGLLVNVTSIRVFRRISPYVQMIAMSMMVLALVLFPVYADVQFIALRHENWLWFFPPYWFAAMQELFGGRTDEFFQAIGKFGVKAFGSIVLLCIITWWAGFVRHYRRTLEAEDSTAGRVRRHSQWADRFLQTPQERGIYRFTGAMLARSPKHRMFLACYWSLGAALGVLAGISVSARGLDFSEAGMRGLPFLLTFFTVSGLRAVFQFPAELNANWLFQMAEASWGRAARRATRMRILTSGLVPALVLFTPFEVARWGAAGLMHVGLEGLAGMLLAEAMFWTFDKVPFTCSYFPGRMNLALLVVFYLYGFTTYSFTMADVEKWIEGHPLRGSGVVLLAIIALRLVWRSKTGTEMIRFDGSEPEIQVLDLS